MLRPKRRSAFTQRNHFDQVGFALSADWWRPVAPPPRVSGTTLEFAAPSPSVDRAAAIGSECVTPCGEIIGEELT
jgi:hypothetical protein